ncbi:exodeoxyribonuclease VII large subunit [Cysteiniphilum halobium]|nr:exodeoxyribonuclease VII large subunit [Cysteiniphilum halobium]
MAEPATQTDTTSFTLSQFLTEIKQTIDRKFKGGGYWVRARTTTVS